MRPLRAVRLEGPQRDEHDFDVLYVVPASLEPDFDDWHVLTVPLRLDFNFDFGYAREIIPTILGDGPDFDVSYVLDRPDFDVCYAFFAPEPGFDVIYLLSACRLAASTRWRRGKPFGGSLRPTAGQRPARAWR